MATFGETKLPKLRNGSKTVQARVFTTGSLTFYLERCHAPFDGREGEGSEKKRGRERRQRGREICRLFVNADMYKCLAIFNMAMVRTTL